MPNGKSADLFAALNVSAYHSLIDYVTVRVSNQVALRHDYPMWPKNGHNPYDEYEDETHRPVRHMYYQNTLTLLRVLRRLRKM